MSADWPLATAAATRPADLFGQVWPWLVALVAVVGVGALVLYLLKRYMGRPGSRAGEGFTLQELRELRASGALSEEEFERAKAAVIGRVTAPDTHQPSAREPAEPDPDV
jgi:hypothetical protein